MCQCQFGQPTESSPSQTCVSVSLDNQRNPVHHRHVSVSVWTTNGIQSITDMCQCQFGQPTESSPSQTCVILGITKAGHCSNQESSWSPRSVFNFCFASLQETYKTTTKITTSLKRHLFTTCGNQRPLTYLIHNFFPLLSLFVLFWWSCLQLFCSLTKRFSLCAAVWLLYRLASFSLQNDTWTCHAHLTSLCVQQKQTQKTFPHVGSQNVSLGIKRPIFWNGHQPEPGQSWN